MEGVPDVAYDEVKESHYREGGLISVRDDLRMIWGGVRPTVGKRTELFDLEKNT